MKVSDVLAGRGNFSVVVGDCRRVLATLPDASVDAIVTDPPYGLEFMGKDWDKFREDDPGTNRNRGARAGTHGEAGEGDGSNPARGNVAVAYGGGKRPSTFRCVGCGKRDQFRNEHPCPGGNGRWARELIDPHAAPPTMVAFQSWCREWAREAFRVLKPGAHVLAFGGTRTYHRMTCGLEEAGFEIRDTLAWIHGQGFPKSLDVSKAIDKEKGAERRVVSTRVEHDITRPKGGGDERLMTSRGARETREVATTAPTTAEAREWEGWGTALKPAQEPIVLARKPLAGTVAGNVLEFGTGGINVNACRIGSETRFNPPTHKKGTLALGSFENCEGEGTVATGRWPANVVLDREAGAMLDAQTGELTSGANPKRRGADGERVALGEFAGQGECDAPRGKDVGGASRFFYRVEDDPAAPAGREGEASADRRYGDRGVSNFNPTPGPRGGDSAGRWPANVVLDEEAGAMLDEQTGEKGGGYGVRGAGPTDGRTSFALGGQGQVVGYGDSGGASRFFYCAKASKAEREKGLEALPATGDRRNVHPTVKPLALMEWLVRMVTPPGGVVLDPFTGSGSTLAAAVRAGFRALGIEKSPEYAAIARARIAAHAPRRSRLLG